MPHNIHSFEERPPRVAYVDPSFFINLMVTDSTFFEECKIYSEKLKGCKTVLVLSNLGLDEIWYVLLKLLAMRDYGKKWQNILKKDPDVVKKYSKDIEKVSSRIENVITTDSDFNRIEELEVYTCNY